MQISETQATIFTRMEAAPQETGDVTGGGLRLSPEQSQHLGKMIFIEKMDVQFSRNIPEFADLEQDDRDVFLVACLQAAEARGLVTEQGVVSYALAAWWLGIGFEEKSRYLVPLFESGFPEVRKVYAMNEWVHAVIGEPENLSAADERLKLAFFKTREWGGVR